MRLTKEDFNIEYAEKRVYITPKVEDIKRNEQLDFKTQTTFKHTYNADVTYYSNNGTLGVTSLYFSNEVLLEKAISYYNWK
jgi:hypothetical protein